MPKAICVVTHGERMFECGPYRCVNSDAEFLGALEDFDSLVVFGLPSDDVVEVCALWKKHLTCLVPPKTTLPEAAANWLVVPMHCPLQPDVVLTMSEVPPRLTTTYFPDVVERLVALIRSKATGVVHLGEVECFPAVLAQRVFVRSPWAVRGWIGQESRCPDSPAAKSFAKVLDRCPSILDVGLPPRPKKSILITGAYGFIGSHFANRLIRDIPDDTHVFLLDNFSYSAKVANVDSTVHDLLVPTSQPPRVTTLCLDLVHDDLSIVTKIPNLTHVFHFAAQTHVDNSYENAFTFTSANVLGTQRLLDVVRSCLSPQFVGFVHVSTDEVFGETHDAPTTVLCPTNPYAASKAAAEMYVLAYSSSYKIPVAITRCNNVFGPGQFPEKLIPKTVKKFLSKEPMTVHGDGSQRRTFLYVSDVADAFIAVFRRGEPKVAPAHPYYHIGADESHEYTTREIIAMVAGVFVRLGFAVPTPMTVDVPDRPFNDARYLLDASSIHALGWRPKISVANGMHLTVLEDLSRKAYDDLAQPVFLQP